ncbi:STAS domain-containing protein [Priestia megaterium]|nr:STAS domain-containing protein [Priestia megaterium]
MMNTHLLKIRERILDEKHEIAHSITQEQNELYPGQLKPLTNELLPIRVELVTFFAESIALEDSIRVQQLEKWGMETGTRCAALGATLDAMLNEVPHYRKLIGQIIKEEAMRAQLTLEQFYEVLSVFDQTVDEVVYYFSVPFVEYNAEQLKNSQEALLELSVPVVPIANGVAVLPVIGTIDTYRARLLMEQALEESVKRQISHFVLDLSGVPILDTYVASRIFQILEALKLIGVNAKISGITPEIAQTAVSLGLGFGQVQTFSTLRQALIAIGFTYNEK